MGRKDDADTRFHFRDAGVTYDLFHIVFSVVVFFVWQRIQYSSPDIISIIQRIHRFVRRTLQIMGMVFKKPKNDVKMMDFRVLLNEVKVSPKQIRK